MMLIATS